MPAKMWKRILFGLLMGLLLLAVFWLDHHLQHEAGAWGAPIMRPIVAAPLAALLALIGILGFRELARLTAEARLKMLPLSGLASVLAIATMPFWWRLILPGKPEGRIVIVVMGLLLTAVFTEQMIRARTNDALRRLACTVLAVMYLGVPCAMILSIRINYGVPALLMFVAAVKFTDMGAYFIGSALGRHKLIRWLSPKKSWEGLFGGLALGVAASVVVCLLVPVPKVRPWQAGLFGLLVGAAGQFGDLCESLLKRSVRRKDSGGFVPAFGGVLDIVDSVLMSAPVALVLMMAIAG